MTDQSMIVPLRIQFYLSGDIAGQDQLGFSLAAWMIIIMIGLHGPVLDAAQEGRTMAVVDPTGLSAIVDVDAPGGPAPATGVRPARGLGRLGPIVVVIACGLFFVLPLLAMARFALQNVPMVRLGWSTLFDKWSFSGITKAFHEARVPHVAVR